MSSNPSEKSAVSFRGTLNGYNKEDVNAYIEEMNMKFADTESEYKKIILTQKKQIDEINLQLFEAKASINSLSSTCEQYKSRQAELEKVEIEQANNQKKNSECNAVIGALNDKLDQLSSEYCALKDDFNKISLERDALFDKVTQLTGERDEFVTENTAVKPAINEPETAVKSADPSSASDSEKARMYDKISRQVGSMLIDAREIADNIIDDANIHADKIITSAENKAKEICVDADIKLNHTLNYIKNTLKRMSSDCMSEYIEHINNSRSALDKLLGDTSADADAVYTRFDTIIKSTLLDLNKGIDKITSNSITESSNTSNEPDPANSSCFME
ncbi:MAG: hypothetical protein ACYCWE_13935 [Eubacteriales bacterium]